MKSFKDNKGFTLVEMAVVVVILGLMAALILPGIFRTIERNRLEKGRAAMTALKNEVIGYVITSTNSTLPTDLSLFSGQFDQWGQEVVYVRGLDVNICNQNATDLEVQKIGTSAMTAQHIAFALIGRGKNMVVQTRCNGADCVSGRLAGTVTIFDQGSTNATAFPDYEYDDIVEYVGLLELIGKACP